MASMVTVGIIGAGRIGRLHAENLKYRIPQARITAVSDIRLEAAQKCAHELALPLAIEDYHAVINDPGIDAVVVCSSTNTHSQIIGEAADAGKHIFCEKPIDFDLERIDRALEKVKRAEVKLQLGFNRRFDPDFRRAWELIKEGKIGTPHILRITSRDPQPPSIEYIKSCGGIFLDMTIHDFDMARYLVGSEVEEIYTIGGVLVEPEIRKIGDLDTAIMSLSFGSGVLGSIDNSRKAVYGYDQRVEVFGSEGMIAVSNAPKNRVRLSTERRIQEDPPLFFFMDRYTESYVEEMKEFIRCIAEDRNPSVSGIDGRISVVMGKAARLSYEKKRPVKLSEISEETGS